MLAKGIIEFSNPHHARTLIPITAAELRLVERNRKSALRAASGRRNTAPRKPGRALAT